MMRVLWLALGGLLCVSGLACNELALEPASDEAAPPRPERSLEEETETNLQALDSAGAYGVPDIPLKTDENYAETAEELEPFRHIQPYKQHFLEQMVYTGPGRGLPEPEQVTSVKIGFIGPIMPTVSVATGGMSHEETLGVKMLQGARLAVEHANAQGGYHQRDIPFELMVHNDNGLWGASGNEIIDMAYKENVWAILGTIDGANSHIAIRVALKAEVLMMNSGDTDPTFVETNIPWTMRCISDDRQMSYLLVDYLYRKCGFKRIGIIRSSNRYGRFGVREIKDSSRRLGRPIVQEMAYQLGIDDFSLHLERLQLADVDAVIHWGNAREGALILNQMRTRGMKQPYYACDRCVSEEFVELAGDHADGVICTFPWDPMSQHARLLTFREAFQTRFGEEAETYAAHAYDGMNMMIWAIQNAGLNRAKIRDLLAYRTHPWEGVTGDIKLSAVLDDGGEVFLAKREQGAWRYYSRPELDIPTDPPEVSQQVQTSALTLKDDG